MAKAFQRVYIQIKRLMFMFSFMLVGMNLHDKICDQTLTLIHPSVKGGGLAKNGKNLCVCF